MAVMYRRDGSVQGGGGSGLADACWHGGARARQSEDDETSRVMTMTRAECEQMQHERRPADSAHTTLPLHSLLRPHSSPMPTLSLCPPPTDRTATAARDRLNVHPAMHCSAGARPPTSTQQLTQLLTAPPCSIHCHELVQREVFDDILSRHGWFNQGVHLAVNRTATSALFMAGVYCAMTECASTPWGMVSLGCCASAHPTHHMPTPLNTMPPPVPLLSTSTGTTTCCNADRPSHDPHACACLPHHASCCCCCCFRSNRLKTNCVPNRSLLSSA